LFSYATVGRRDLAASSSRLSDARLASVLQFLESASPEAQTRKLFRGGSELTSLAGPSLHPDELASAHGGSVPVVVAPVVVLAPVVPAPVVLALVVPTPVVPTPVVLAPVVPAPVVLAPGDPVPMDPAPVALRRGRHRSQAPWKVAIVKLLVALHTIGLRALRIAMTGARVALAAVTTVLTGFKVWVLRVLQGRWRSSTDRHSVGASGDLAGPSGFLPKASKPSQTRH
jgi:hypothetical protein